MVEARQRFYITQLRSNKTHNKIQKIKIFKSKICRLEK